MAKSYDNYLEGNDNWTIIPRTSSTVPKPGDLFVSETDSAGYGYGHVGIVLVVYGSTSADIIEMSGGVKPTVNYGVRWGSTASYYAEHFIRFNYFKQSVDTYTISYDANGGTGAPGNQTKTAGKALTLSGTKPTRSSASAGSYKVTLNANGGNVSTASLTAARTTKYTFKNWNTKKDGTGTAYAAGASYAADANVTLFAQWNSSTSTASVTLPTPTRYGYTFKGWGTSSTASSGKTGSYTPGGNVTLYALWQKEDLEGWSTKKPDTIYEDQIETATQYRYAEKTITGGWTKTGSGTIDYVQSWPSGFNTSHSLYSKYNKTPKTVGVSGNKKVEATTAANGYIYWHWCRNEITNGPTNRLIEDHYESPYVAFHGFFSTEEGTPYSGDSSVYRLDNGGACAESYWWWRIPVYRQTYTEYTGSDPVATWSDWSDWTMTRYSTGDTRKEETRTVYRYKSSVKPFQVTFDPNGGKCATASKSVIGGETYGALPEATRTDLTFDGWYTAKDGGTLVTTTTRVTATVAHTLYAHWTKNHTHTPGQAVRENEVPATTTAGGSYDEVVYCTACNEELSRETRQTAPLPTQAPTATQAPAATQAPTATQAPAATPKPTANPTPKPTPAPTPTPEPATIKKVRAKKSVKLLAPKVKKAKYQWYVRADRFAPWQSLGRKGTKQKLTVKALKAMDGFQYRCRVISRSGITYTDIYELYVYEQLKIRKQPKWNKVSVPGAKVMLTITAQGADRYQWLMRPNSRSAWRPIQGATGTSYMVDVQAGMAGYQFACQVSGRGGTKLSKAATVKMVKPAG